MLKVGKTRHNKAKMLLTLLYQFSLKLCQKVYHYLNLITSPEPQVKGNLIVSASGGMELFASLANPLDQSRFDIHMHVFERLLELELSGKNFRENSIETLNNRILFFFRNEFTFGKHRRVGNTPFDIVFIEPPVKGNRLSKCLHRCRRLLCKPPAPGLFLFHIVQTFCFNQNFAFCIFYYAALFPASGL